jgi:hypothetical protein
MRAFKPRYTYPVDHLQHFSPRYCAQSVLQDVDKVRSEIEPGAAQKADALPVEPAATGQLV